MRDNTLQDCMIITVRAVLCNKGHTALDDEARAPRRPDQHHAPSNQCNNAPSTTHDDAPTRSGLQERVLGVVPAPWIRAEGWQVEQGPLRVA